MNTLRRSLRSTSTGFALVVALTVVLVPATAAYAGDALPATPYDGASLHGRYTVDLTATCSDPNETYCTNAKGYVPPTSLSIDLYTHPRPGSGCKADGYEFDLTTISPNGSFSATEHYSGSPQLTFTVGGTFLSVGSVHGTITGNDGCGTDSFTINLHPAPLISTPPCEMLTKVHAQRTIEGALAVSSGSATFDAAGGTCELYFGSYDSGGDLEFIVAATAAQAGYSFGDQEGPWAHQRPLAGLGAGATLYYDNAEGINGKPDASVLYFEVEFHRSGVWASLTNSAGSNGHCLSGSVHCFSPAGFAAREGQVVAAAKALLPLL
jgi:hypothetical protein